MFVPDGDGEGGRAGPGPEGRRERVRHVCDEPEPNNVSSWKLENMLLCFVYQYGKMR